MTFWYNCYIIKIIFLLLDVCIVKYLLLLIFLLLNLYSEDKIKFGVFAYLGYEQTKAKYEPLVKYLNYKLKKEVVLEILESK